MDREKLKALTQLFVLLAFVVSLSALIVWGLITYARGETKDEPTEKGCYLMNPEDETE